MVGIYQINRFYCLLMCLFFFHETKTFANEPTARHAIAMHGAPKYPRNFQHFEYVNPNAPKGGAVVNEATGTFDSFNAFILKGIPAAGIGLFMTRSWRGHRMRHSQIMDC